MNRSRFAAAAALLATLSLAPAAPGANLIANGSFETGPSPGALMPLGAGSTAISSWTVTRAGIDYAGTAWTAAQGVRSIALNGADAGGIAQDFETLPHAIYTVRFYMAGDPGTLPNLKTLRVAAAGQSADFTADITGMWEWDPGWNWHAWSFQANATTTTLEFLSTMTGATGPTIDSVTVALTSTADVGPGSLAAVALAPVSPNPARGAALFSFSLARPGAARLSVYDVAGRELAVLADGELAAGSHEASWNGGGSAGLFYAVLHTSSGRLVRPFVVIR